MAAVRGILCSLSIGLISLSALAQEPRGDTVAKDTSPHASRFVSVSGVRLHYLDWGGVGEAVLLLAAAEDAHVFDSFAPKLVEHWHTLALTRRGFGESDKTEKSQVTATQIDDIRQFMDALNISRAHMLGHSMAADLLTAFASRYPGRVRKLVYFDPPVDDRKGDLESLLTIPSLPPAQRKFALDVLGRPEATGIEVPNLPANYRAQVEFVREGLRFTVDYSRIQAPALALFAVPAKSPADPKRRATIEHLRSELRNARIVEMQGATHYLFLGNTQDEAVRYTTEFLSQ